MNTLDVKNLLPISITLLAIFLANATAKTATFQTMAHKVFASAPASNHR